MPGTEFLAFKKNMAEEWKGESGSYPVEMVEKR
jgi:hypothetical protein